MITMNSANNLSTVYATKRRRRNGKSLKPQPKEGGSTKSNPSKRHRERLNAELDTLASLLPFEQNILTKLDKLSILRLAVSYLRTKSYFQVSVNQLKNERLHHSEYRNRDHLGYPDAHWLLDPDGIMQALSGFLLILDCQGEVFFATHTIENYLGFHQSDIVHQSVYELVHSEDREELQRQLMWNSFLPPDASSMTLGEVLLPENAIFLERSFTVRFRCLLDNTSGFLRLDIRGRIKVLHGQNRKTEEPPLALFALCTPFGPPSLLDAPQKEVMFKSKHKLDMTLVSMDQRGKLLLSYTDEDLHNRGGYDLVHYDDLAYIASAHQELLKTGASGMICYRLQAKDGTWQWLQTSSRLVYKNSKPDFIISTHRPLMEEEGRDLLGKRTMDFKVSYLDATFNSNYMTDSELMLSPSSNNTSGSTSTTPKAKKYKTQLKEYMTAPGSTTPTTGTSGTKAKKSKGSSAAAAAAAAAAAVAAAGTGMTAMPTVGVPMTHHHHPGGPEDALYNSAAAAASYNNVYAATAAYPPPVPADNGSLYTSMQPNFQNLYPAIDNRLLSTAAAADNLFGQYRHFAAAGAAAAGYYTDYATAAAAHHHHHHHHPAHHTYMSNGFLDPRASLGYDTQLVKPAETKFYPTIDTMTAAAAVAKYEPYENSFAAAAVATNYASAASLVAATRDPTSPTSKLRVASELDSTGHWGSTSLVGGKPASYPSSDTRQSIWTPAATATTSSENSSVSPRGSHHTDSTMNSSTNQSYDHSGASAAPPPPSGSAAPLVATPTPSPAKKYVADSGATPVDSGAVDPLRSLSAMSPMSNNSTTPTTTSSGSKWRPSSGTLVTKASPSGGTSPSARTSPHHQHQQQYNHQPQQQLRSNQNQDVPATSSSTPVIMSKLGSYSPSPVILQPAVSTADADVWSHHSAALYSAHYAQYHGSPTVGLGIVDQTSTLRPGVLCPPAPQTGMPYPHHPHIASSVTHHHHHHTPQPPPILLCSQSPR